MTLANYAMSTADTRHERAGFHTVKKSEQCKVEGEMRPGLDDAATISPNPRKRISLVLPRPSPSRSPERKADENEAAAEDSKDTDLMMKLATQERKVKLLREDLLNAQRELRAIRKEWATREAQRHKSERPKQEATSTSGSSTAPATNTRRALTPLSHNIRHDSPQPTKTNPEAVFPLQEMDVLQPAKKLAGEVRDMAYTFFTDLRDINFSQETAPEHPLDKPEMPAERIGKPNSNANSANGTFQFGNPEKQEPHLQRRRTLGLSNFSSSWISGYATEFRKQANSLLDQIAGSEEEHERA